MLNFHQAASFSKERLLLAAAACLLLQSCKTDRENPLVETFEDAGSPFSAALFEHPAISIAEKEGVSGSNAIKVLYEGFPKGSRRVLAKHRLPFAAAEATLTYDVKFCEGFDFVKGGKLHGLGPARPVSGGGEGHPERWSARVNFKAGGGIATYLYLQDRPHSFGETTTSESFKFERGKFQAVSLNVRVNDPPSAKNGHARVYVDGELVVNKENIRFRAADGEGTLVNQVLFSTFHGGNTESYAPRNSDGSYRTECAYFDNFAVHPSLKIKEAPGI